MTNRRGNINWAFLVLICFDIAGFAELIRLFNEYALENILIYCHLGAEPDKRA